MTGKTEEIEDKVKLHLIGDENVGKTALIMTCYLDKKLPTYLPSIQDTAVTMPFAGKSVLTNIFDMSGAPQYQRLRYLSYPGTSIFILCFSIDCHTSFNNLKKIWIPELFQHTTNIPIVLVGTKSDLRSDDTACVSYTEGLELSKEIQAVKYIECSSMTQEGVNNVFEEAFQAAMIHKKQSEKNSCLIL